MSEEEFLARWSRRKRESRPEPAKPAEAQPAPPPEAKDGAKDVAKDGESEFDLSSLPSIDEITAATDDTAFLRKHAELFDRIPKKELASYLNLSAETLSRLKQRGKI